MARAPDRRTRSAARASRSTGWAISRVSSSEETRVTAIGDQDEGHQRQPLGGDDLVDVAGLQGQHAQHRLHVLDRDRDRDHPLAVLAAAQARHRSGRASALATSASSAALRLGARRCGSRGVAAAVEAQLQLAAACAPAAAARRSTRSATR